MTVACEKFKTVTFSSTHGTGVGAGVGSGVGAGVGAGVGSGVGAGVGAGVGSGVGAGVGAGVGSGVGAGVGAGVGCGVGAGVGAGVGLGQRRRRWRGQRRRRWWGQRTSRLSWSLACLRCCNNTANSDSPASASHVELVASSHDHCSPRCAGNNVLNTIPHTHNRQSIVAEESSQFGVNTSCLLSP